MYLSLKKRIQGNRSFSNGRAFLLALLAATVISLLSVSVLLVTDSVTLANPDLWLTLISHYVFMVWFFPMSFWIFRVCTSFRNKVLLVAGMMVISAPILALLVAKLQMLCNTGSYYTFEGRLTSMLGTAVSDAITVLIVCLLRYWYDSYALKNKENERLRIENLNTRLDALKKQLSPHFLFNSLNTLRGLISPENVEARQYVDGMAQVYRYTIQDREVVAFRDEMAFVRSYAYMLQMRYGKALRIVLDCSERYGYMRILPMSVQLLVENAVKHNVLSPDAPLEVRVYTTEDARVVVRNRINPRDNGSVESAGTGLSNLFERYRLRFGASVDIDTSDGFFTVSVPLFESDKMTGK